jgi:hypothetical protein
MRRCRACPSNWHSVTTVTAHVSPSHTPAPHSPPRTRTRRRSAATATCSPIRSRPKPRAAEAWRRLRGLSFRKNIQAKPSFTRRRARGDFFHATRVPVEWRPGCRGALSCKREGGTAGQPYVERVTHWHAGRSSCRRRLCNPPWHWHGMFMRLCRRLGISNQEHSPNTGSWVTSRVASCLGPCG